MHCSATKPSPEADYGMSNAALRHFKVGKLEIFGFYVQFFGMPRIV